MDIRLVIFALTTAAVISHSRGDNTNIWSGILSCIHGLANETDTANPEAEIQENLELSAIKLVSVICGKQDGFVRCLEESLHRSTDSMSQVILSLFDADTVAKAYEGLCNNISNIDHGNVLGCLSEVSLVSCQNELADYFFYMGVVKQFAPAKDQLSRDTLETLLCSVTAQRRQCEVEALSQCSPILADVMEEFYQETQPEVCVQQEKQAAENAENQVLQSIV